MAQREAVRMKATGDTKMRPKTEVLENDPKWETDVLNEYAYLTYLQDYRKLPADQRAQLESLAE